MQLSALESLRAALDRICPTTWLNVADLEIFFGPNPLSSQPIVLCTLEIGPDFPGEPELAKRAKALLGGSVLHWEGGEVRKAAKAGATGRLAATLASDLVCDGMGMPFASGSQSLGPKRTCFWIEFLTERVAIRAVRLAVLAIGAAASGAAAAEPIGRELARFDEICARRKPNSESRVLLTGARARNIPFLQMSDYASLWQFGWGECSERFWVSSSNRDGVVGGLISHTKLYQKSLFTSLGIPTPKWRLLNPASNLDEAVKAIGYPCVVKPIDSGGGKGVNAQIQDMASLSRAVAAASRYSRQVLMEEFQPGEDFRLMVIDGKMAMTIKRSPSAVVGDGKRSVDDLLEALNETRRRDAKRGGYLKVVPKDDGVRLALADQGLDLTSVPRKGQTVRLRTNANHATGGVCTDVTDRTHEQIKRYAEQLALALGFRVLGVDYITPDIGKSHDEVGGAFLEVNATPGLEVLLTDGASAETIGALVLGPKPGRIPVCLLLADAPALDAVGTALRETLAGGAGAAAADWAQLGPVPMPQIPLPPVERARSLLRYPALKTLVILWTPEELCRFGLPVDAVDLAVVLEKPAGEWMELLDRHAGKLLEVDTIGEAARIASEWSTSSRPERGAR